MTNRINPIIPSTRPTAEKDPAYTLMLSSAATSQLGTVTTKGSPLKRDEVTGEVTIHKGPLTVTIQQYLEGGKERELKVSTQKLLDLCMMELTRINDYKGKAQNLKVTIPIDRYMERLGIPNTKASKDRARRIIAEDLDTLYNLSFRWADNSGKKTPDHLDTRICTLKGIYRGNIEFSFTPELGNHLIDAYITQYPTQLLALDGRNPAAYQIGRKLAYHYSMRNNHKRGTAGIISLNALLKDCPAIPSYKEIMETDRALERRIIFAVRDAIDSLPFIEEWDYCNAKKVPETTEQRKEPITLDKLNNLYITFTLKDHPETGQISMQ